MSNRGSNEGQMTYSQRCLHQLDEEDEWDKMSNMGTLNSSMLHRSTHSLRSLNSLLDHIDVAADEEEEDTFLPLQTSGIKGTMSQIQQVNFSDQGFYGEFTSKTRPSQMNERSYKQICHPEETNIQLQKNHKYSQSKKICSENAHHQPAESKPSQNIPKTRKGILLNWPAHAALQNYAVPSTNRFNDLYDDDDDIDWYSTCSSSSSDSEEEGFFLGKPIPKPRCQSLHYYTEDSRNHPTSSHIKSKKKSLKGKKCIIS